ncbi:MAG: hypothetical protein IJR87_03305 [Bacteroidaceae bacterium]|nr:hypothetical protein [Bacteroidaceae bacterium]
MKKLAFVFAAVIAVSFASCGNKAQQAETEETACVCGAEAPCKGECEECTCGEGCDAACKGEACDTTACEGQCPEGCAEAEAPAAE